MGRRSLTGVLAFLAGFAAVAVLGKGIDGHKLGFMHAVVPNGILVFSSAPTGPIASLTVRAESPRIYATQSTGFTVFGQDAAYNPVPFDRAAIAWEGWLYFVTK